MNTPRYQPPQPQRRTGLFTFNLKELLVVLGILGVLTAFLKPIFDQASSASRPGCLSYGKQLSLAAMMYTQDYDEHLPLASNWYDATYPYYKNKALVCPERPSGHGVGYAMDDRLSGRSLDNVGAPHATRPLLYESSNLKPNAHDAMSSFAGRHKNKTGWIGFVDGHVKGGFTKLP
ncbi:type II secretion system protein [Armatimonas sp.]|uniref:type II secretion system protein n=1 Tax=Armatimonas sp. TaxID=1872638 RepID=UPI003751F92C